MRWRLPVLTVLGVAFVGCSSEPYQIAQVSGRITMDGKPVEKAVVMFQPVAPKGNLNPGPGSFGITDADGRYTLELVGLKKKGVAVGHHKVRIENYTEPEDTTDDRPNRRRAKPAVVIPTRYYYESPFEFDVTPSGSNDANFDMTSKPAPGKEAGSPAGARPRPPGGRDKPLHHARAHHPPASAPAVGGLLR